MKRTIRILSVCLVFSLLCTVCLYAAPASSDGDIADKMSDAISEIESPLVVSKERMERESAALIQYNDLIKGMQSITKSKNEYPESYGGAYIDDSGDLVVCITESSDRASATEMVKTLSKNPDVKTKVVKYSLNHLHQSQDKISDAMIEVSEQTRTKSIQKHSYYELIKDISSVYTDEKDNILVVGILDLNDEKVDLFKKVFPDVDCTVFEKGGINSTTTTQWRPGRKIYTATDGWLSTGYPVYFTDLDGATHRGFITAGHSFVIHINAYTSTGAAAGNILASREDYQYSGSVDAALMEIIHSDYVMSTTTEYGISLSTESFAYIAQNATVYKEGARTHLTTGQVTSTNVTVQYDDDDSPILTDLLETTALNLHGDSGGVMYTYIFGEYHIVGSMSGSRWDSDSDELTAESFQASYVCKASNAINALGFWIE